MFNTHLSYVKVIGDVVFTGEFSYALAVLCGFDIFVRDKVIHDQSYFIFIKYGIYRHFIHLMNRYR